MRGKDFNTGLRGVLFEAQHYERMGSAVWLYGWLVLRQTHQVGARGWVLGGSPVSYREIEEETGFNSRTLERWMHTLRRGGYIETEAAPGGVIISITKAKKFPQGARGFADAARRIVGRGPQNGGDVHSYPESNQRPTQGMGSSFLAKSQERNELAAGHQDLHRGQNTRGNPISEERSNSSPLDQTETQPISSGRGSQGGYRPEASADARLLRRLLRTEREEAVRRELAVGTGPEVGRT